TQNRQDAMKELARRAGLVLVVGAPTSSNANRLVEVARAAGADSYLIEAPEDIRPEWLTGDVGLTAGASTPEHVVQGCIERVRELGGHKVEEFRLLEERVWFPLPGELLAEATERNVPVGAGNERAAERAANEFKIRHHWADAPVAHAPGPAPADAGSRRASPSSHADAGGTGRRGGHARNRSARRG